MSVRCSTNSDAISRTDAVAHAARLGVINL
jgi:hypothetical protein